MVEDERGNSHEQELLAKEEENQLREKKINDEEKEEKNEEKKEKGEEKKTKNLGHVHRSRYHRLQALIERSQ